MNKQETYQDLENKSNTKYYIPDMDSGEPIEVTEEVYKAYSFLLDSLKDYENIKKSSPSRQFKDKGKKDGNGKR